MTETTSRNESAQERYITTVMNERHTVLDDALIPHKPSPLPDRVELPKQLRALRDETAAALVKLSRASFLTHQAHTAHLFGVLEAYDSSLIEDIAPRFLNVFVPFADTSYQPDGGEEEVAAAYWSQRVGFAGDDNKDELSVELINNIHRSLMDTKHGRDFGPGEIRQQQNYIGGGGFVSFVPPAPDDIAPAMKDLVAFINRQHEDPLTAVALAHHQFETIHPYLDGNGRTGRALALCQMVRYNLLPASCPLPLSSTIWQRRDEYYFALSSVRDNSEDYTEWIEFFLSSILSQAITSTRQVKKLQALRDTYRMRLGGLPHAQDVAEFLVGNPVVSKDSLYDAMRPKLTRKQTAEFMSALTEAETLRPFPDAYENLGEASGAIEMLEMMRVVKTGKALPPVPTSKLLVAAEVFEIVGRDIS